jgi:ribosomal protein S18 acetylase RimI-like enzyme
MFTSVITKQQITTVERLAREIWTEHYVPIIGKEQVDYMLKTIQSAEAIARRISEEKYHYFLIHLEKTPVGYLAVQPRKDDLLLSKIDLARERRGCGIGRKSVEFTEELARELEKPVVTLTVNRHNSGAIAAYSRQGFRIVNRTVADIGGGFVMDDYIMQKEVPAAR